MPTHADFNAYENALLRTCMQDVSLMQEALAWQAQVAQAYVDHVDTGAFAEVGILIADALLSLQSFLNV